MKKLDKPKKTLRLAKSTLKNLAVRSFIRAGARTVTIPPPSWEITCTYFQCH